MLATGCYRLLAELRALQASMLGITLLNDEHELLVGCEPPSAAVLFRSEPLGPAHPAVGRPISILE